MRREKKSASGSGKGLLKKNHPRNGSEIDAERERRHVKGVQRIIMLTEQAGRRGLSEAAG